MDLRLRRFAPPTNVLLLIKPCDRYHDGLVRASDEGSDTLRSR